ncbi:MAG: 16S rRNA (guanine(966)-N(2))-methyltransferase RsmD [Candidatus Margulisbacteria bacterium GWF2_35_9]|nr:MAG: 16S rRNA (guanine(966)-N(2))-methyltransferase RsmD [Candidatus Margulisbacteria bacterium GWF2_35_9]
MIVLSGIYKSKKLEFKSSLIRPTSSKVKEALFSIIGDTINGSHFLDLFCGTGAVGIEALSRGASEVVGIDLNINIASKNIKTLGLNSFKLYRNDSLRALDVLSKRKINFDLIFIDPPYDYPEYKALLLSISKFDILKTGGKLFVEMDSIDLADEKFNSLKHIKTYGYGQTKILYFIKE